MAEYEYESVSFPYAMKDYSQVVIYERSLDDIMAYDTRFCHNRARKFLEERYNLVSCSRVWPIMKNNRDDLEIEFFCNADDALPLLYNNKTKTYEKIDRLPLDSHLTVLFWCNNRIRFEYMWRNRGSIRDETYHFVTRFRLKGPAILSKIDLLHWRAGMQNQESLRLVPNMGPYCWLKTNIFYHVRTPGEPLSLKQLCHTVIMANNMKKFKGREKIALAAVPPGVAIPRSITVPRFYEVVMMTNPVILTDPDEYNRNFNRNDPFLDLKRCLARYV
jgi:hypothetical protein